MKIKFNKELIIALLINFVLLPCQPFCNVPSDWINQARNICYGPKTDEYAEFQVKQDCPLVAIRLIHVSGLSQCHADNKKARWGCSKNKHLSTIIMNVTPKMLFVPENFDDNITGYSISGFGMDDDVIILKKRANLSVGEKFRVLSSESLKEKSDYKGIHCIDVDVSCLI